MEQLLNSGLEVVIRSGFLYLPLLYDADIAGEVAGPADSSGDIPHSHLLRVAGKCFIKALNLASLAANYPEIHPREYERRRVEFLQKFGPALPDQELSLGPNLRTIIFKVLPHFLRRTSGLSRQPRSHGEILDLIREKLEISPDYGKMAEELTQSWAWHRSRSLPQRLPGEEPEEAPSPPGEGLIAAAELRPWLRQILDRKIWEQEKTRLEQARKGRAALRGISGKRRLALLYLAAVGSLELDGFGFTRLRLPDDYLIYRRTGEFALKDFYGRVYLFPDCRVAVSTIPPLRPVVLETYKHPLLPRHAPGQTICISLDFAAPKVFSGADAIAALEEGVSALFHNYSSRAVLGYHKLGDVKRPYQTVDFDDLKIPRDHPALVSGRIEVKNEFT